MLSGAKDYLTGPGVTGDWTPCGPKAREEEMLAAAGFRPVRVPASPVRHVPNAQFILYAEKVLKRAGVHKPDIPCSGIEAVMEVEVCHSTHSMHSTPWRWPRHACQPAPHHVCPPQCAPCSMSTGRGIYRFTP